jgi:hypothetical protein
MTYSVSADCPVGRPWVGACTSSSQPRELFELGRAKVAGGNHLQQLAHRKTGIGIVGHFCKVLRRGGC